MVTVTTDEATARLPSLLAAVEEKGEVVQICRAGKPVAELRSVNQVEDPLRVHPELSKVKFHEDPMAPLEPEDWPGADL